MAGMNTPKPSARRARRGGRDETIIEFVKGEQPDLPEEIDWPERTRAWWLILSESPLADGWTAEDWQYLMDTALIHADVWGGGNFDRLAELRIRVERFGVTPAARASLRIQLAEAEKAEKGKKGTTDAPAESRHAGLRAVAPVTQLKKA